MSGKLYIGTAGWTYKDWGGVVYPEGKRKGFDELKFLGQFFNVSEVNTTFYRIPNQRMTESWARRGQQLGEFFFIVKLFQGFTHTREKLDRSEVDAFKFGIAPLVDAQLLASILIQFPWSFRGKEENFGWLRLLVDEFDEFPLAVEVRHSSWLVEEYFKFLKQRKITFVNIDQPRFRDSVGATEYSFTDNAYFRFHGRNRENWFRDTAGPDERYDYLYSQGELEEWVPRILRAKKKGGRVFVIYNNHFCGKAVSNALEMKAALENRKLRIPRELLVSFPQLEKIALPVKEDRQLGLF